MKEKILNLRSLGKSYLQIQKELGCSKSTISYHCGEGQKQKNDTRRVNRRRVVLKKRIDTFRHIKQKNVTEAIRKYQKRVNIKGTNKVNKSIEKTFTWKDVLDKFGENTKCYLTGLPIDICNDDFSLDHITPVSRGGSNSIENMGICLPMLNYMKNSLTLTEFVNFCKMVVNIHA